MQKNKKQHLKKKGYMILDGYIAPNSGGKSVASVVENRLIGIVGNNLILPVAPGYKLDPTYSVDEDKPVTLFQHYEPLTPLPPYRVSVPTRGVFAEAIQGACNSCEKIDNTRFWKWEEHPIPDNPTAINPINTPTPVVTNPDLSPTQMPNPIINIQNAPNVPDPQGYNNMLQVLGTKGLFDNITGLDQNQKNALESMLSAQNAAQNYASMASQLANATAQYKLMEDMKQNVDNDASLSAAEKKAKKEEISKKQLGLFGKNTGEGDKYLSTLDNAVEKGYIDDAKAKELGGNYVAKAQDDYLGNDIQFPDAQDLIAQHQYGKSFKVSQKNADGSSLEVESEGKNDDSPLDIVEEQPTDIVILFDANKANSAIEGLPSSFRFMRMRHPVAGARSVIVLIGTANTNNIFSALTINAGGAIMAPNTSINGILLKAENGSRSGDSFSRDNNLDYKFQMASNSSNNMPALSNLIVAEFNNPNNIYVDYGNRGQTNFIAQLVRIYGVVSGREILPGMVLPIQGESYGQIRVNQINNDMIVRSLQFDTATFIGSIQNGVLVFQEVLTALSPNTPLFDTLLGTPNIPNGLWIPQQNIGAWGYFRTAVSLQNSFTAPEQALITANCNPNGFSVIIDAQNITFYSNNGFNVILSITRDKRTIQVFDFTKNLFNPLWEGLVNDN